MSCVEDRRRYPRYPVKNLFADVEGEMFEVENISLIAVWLKGQPELTGPRTMVTFLPEEADGLPPAIEVPATMLRQDERGTFLRFERATMPLMRLVLQQASRHLGVAAYLVK